MDALFTIASVVCCTVQVHVGARTISPSWIKLIKQSVVEYDISLVFSIGSQFQDSNSQLVLNDPIFLGDRLSTRRLKKVDSLDVTQNIK